MAIRPVFIPANGVPLWKSVDVEFVWHAGMSGTQKRKSAISLHDSALDQLQVSRILEVSSKSDSQLGNNLSAFRLRISHPRTGVIPLESAFQGSKRFADYGLLESALSENPREAKSMARKINETNALVGFEWVGQKWPLEPKSWFYDWLYISAVLQSLPDAPAQLRRYDAFTDIEFNPKKSFNCQARSCAIIASTENDDQLRRLIDNPELMIEQSTGRTLDQARLF